jgi:hypothetical protein
VEVEAVVVVVVCVAEIGVVEDVGEGVEDVGAGVEDVGGVVEDVGQGVEDVGEGVEVLLIRSPSPGPETCR